jgi:hypothetical protein
MGRPWFGVAFVLLLLFLVEIGVAVLFYSLSSTDNDLMSIISKAEIGIAGTTGAIATATLKLVDERQARDQERRQVCKRIVGAYNQVKSMRRTLKAWGILGARSEPALQAEEVKEPRTTMATLNDAQLQFEALNRKIKESHLFRHKDIGRSPVPRS